MAQIVMCSSFNPECESIQEFFQRFKCQMSDQLHRLRSNDIKQASLLLRALPVSVISEIQRRIAPLLLTDATLDIIEKHLLQQYTVVKSTIGASVEFITCKQDNLNLEDYARKLNTLAAACKYPHDCLDRLLRDTFVAGLSSSAILSSLIQVCDDLSFRETVERAKLLQTYSQDTKLILSDRSIVHATTSESARNTSQNPPRGSIPPKTYLCYRCGSKGEHYSNDCSAKSRTCNICHKVGHIAKICQKSRNTDNSHRNTSSKQRCNNVHEPAPSCKLHSCTCTHDKSSKQRCNNVHDPAPSCALHSCTCTHDAIHGLQVQHNPPCATSVISGCPLSRASCPANHAAVHNTPTPQSTQRGSNSYHPVPSVSSHSLPSIDVNNSFSDAFLV